ncbi:MAG: carbohydrate kinase family protein [Anaerolineales bacterium]|nr:carbohydrate kinase family protein [Anaerolineales bacterium]
MQYDILVCGPVFCDLIFTGLPVFPSLGKEIFAEDLQVSAGGSAIVAAGIQRLGRNVGLIASLGTDPISDIVWQMLGELGLDRSLITRHPGALRQLTVGLSYPQDRAFITRFERPATPPDLRAILKAHSGRHLHLCSYLTALDVPDACQLAHAAGMSVSLDPGWDEQALRDPGLLGLVKDVDLFMPNRLELEFMAQRDDYDEAASVLLSVMQHGMIVMKNGEHGARLYSHAAEENLHLPALPVRPVDTSGAGDAFDAGFLSAYVQGLPMQVCMQYGIVCGSQAVTARGGTAGLPDLEEVNQWLSKLRL